MECVQDDENLVDLHRQNPLSFDHLHTASPPNTRHRGTKRAKKRVAFAWQGTNGEMGDHQWRGGESARDRRWLLPSVVHPQGRPARPRRRAARAGASAAPGTPLPAPSLARSFVAVGPRRLSLR